MRREYSAQKIDVTFQFLFLFLPFENQFFIPVNVFTIFSHNYLRGIVFYADSCRNVVRSCMMLCKT